MTALLTEAEMREAIEDETSPYYLEDWQARAVLAKQIQWGVPVDVAITGSFHYQHQLRAEGRRPLADRVTGWVR